MHPNCLLRWCVENIGRPAETHCTVCKAELPDWRIPLVEDAMKWQNHMLVTIQMPTLRNKPSLPLHVYPETTYDEFMTAIAREYGKQFVSKMAYIEMETNHPYDAGKILTIRVKDGSTFESMKLIRMYSECNENKNDAKCK